MDISQPLLALLASLGVPVIWLVPISAVIVLLVQKYLPNLKLPTLPVAPNADPKPNPVINPNPVAPHLPNPLSDRPLLSILLQLLSLKAAGGVKVEESQLVDVLVKEATSLKQIELK